MARKRKGSGRAMSMPMGIGLGVGISITVTVLSAVILAWLVSTERVGEEAVGYGCMFIQVLAASTGAIAAWRAIRHKRLMVTGLTVTGYYLVLLLMAMAFGAGFTGMGTTAVTVALGGGITQISALFGSGSGVRRHKIKAFR